MTMWTMFIIFFLFYWFNLVLQSLAAGYVSYDWTIVVWWWGLAKGQLALSAVAVAPKYIFERTEL